MSNVQLGGCGASVGERNSEETIHRGCSCVGVKIDKTKPLF